MEITAKSTENQRDTQENQRGTKENLGGGEEAVILQGPPWPGALKIVPKPYKSLTGVIRPFKSLITPVRFL